MASNTFFILLEIGVFKLFQFGGVYNWSFGKGLDKISYF